MKQVEGRSPDMEYTIGEVSAILSLSRDMIRYYEKQGAIRASRNAENRYRTYDTMEVFWLLEAMVHKSWGVPISEIHDIRCDRYTMNTEKFLDGVIRKREEETEYLGLFVKRLKQLRDNTSLSKLNIGNFWIERIPAAYHFHLVAGRGDEYDRIQMPEEASRFIFSEKMLPFFDSGFTVNGDTVDWEMRIEEEYLKALHATLPEGFTKVPEKYCLCSNIDIGEIGSFDTSVFSVIREYASERAYRVPEGEPVRGFILGRGYEDGHFQRIVRFFLPVTERSE